MPARIKESAQRIFQITAADLGAVGIGWLVRGLATLVACAIPVRRALRTDPAIILRPELSKISARWPVPAPLDILKE